MEASRERLTTQAVCEQTGIAKSKIKYWVQALGLNVPKDGNGAWRWTPELVDQLEMVRSLRELEGRTLESVRRVIGDPRDTPEAYREEPVASSTANHGQPMDTSQIAATVSAVLVPQLVEAINTQTDLAQKYATAAHQIGRLEADNEHLRQERDRLTSELAEARALLEAPKSAAVRPWWRAMFGPP